MKGYNGYEHIEYILESSDSKILKILKDVKLKKELRTMRYEFIIYLRANRKDFDPEEIKNAKTEEDKERIIKKYEKDFKKWQKQRKYNLLSGKVITGYLTAAATLNVSVPTWIFVAVLFGINYACNKEIGKE